ncbi:pectinesterase family protein [Roseimarinus sediminis]|uniref:pectinesterase family protein n=1 Tax=Roseimarinus sediminis TaxID=1610899 RepID=UPI003D1BC8B0
MKQISTILFMAIMLAFTSVSAQMAGTYSYDFRDGTIISKGQSDDGKLSLTGNYSHHGDKYGLNMKVDGTIDIVVDGSSTLQFLGSAYSSLNMVGTAATEGDLGTQNTKVANDLSDTYNFVYSGGEATLHFKTIAGSGNDLYLPLIDIIPAQDGSLATAAEKDIIYSFDLRNGSIIPNETSLNGNYTIEKGLFKIESGSSNAYGYNGDQHGSILKTGNQITLQLAGNSYIKIGGCQYSNGSISVSAENGAFDVNSQPSQTAECYHNDGSSIDFLYAGDAGSVVLTFEGTTYIPLIEIVPVPFEVTFEAWVQKTGTISINETVISYTAGEKSTDNPTVSVSEGTVISSTPESASLRIDLAGQALSAYSPTVSGDIAKAEISGDSIFLTFNDESTKPAHYLLLVADNSQTVKAEAGKTYIYNFADGSVLPQTSYKSLRYTTFVSSDGLLTLNSNTDNEAGQYGYHDASHGAVFFSGNSMDIVVAGNATISFITCTYGSAVDAIFEISDASGKVLGSAAAQNIGGNDGAASSFSYTGNAGVLTATLKSAEFPTAEIYIHGVTIENAAEIISSNGKADVWDFGAEQLDTSLYNNLLDEAAINAWYDEAVTKGSSGNNLPSFTAGVLSWVGGGNDRLRTSNTKLTRYDENLSGVEGYTGRIYVNSAANSGRFMSLTLSEDDELTVMALSQSAGGKLTFEYVPDPSSQTDVLDLPGELTELQYVAKQAGTYHIYDSQDKPSYYRIYRRDARYIALSGSIDVSNAAGIPDNYNVVFTNQAGKSWKATMSGNNYSLKLPLGFSYELSLENANGYIISNENTLSIDENTNKHDVVIQKVALYTVSGSIKGLDGHLGALTMEFVPDPAANKLFVPQPQIDAENASYTVQLEANCTYTVEAFGVNDFFLPVNTIEIEEADATIDLTFEAKPVYAVSIEANGLNEEQKAKLGLTFTHLNEEAYQYTFANITDIALRDGVYSIAYSGLDEYPVKLGLSSNLTVAGAATSKTLQFEAIRKWSFDDKVIENGSAAYNGLLFSGSVKNEVAKGHLAAGGGSTIRVPVNAGDKMRVTFYYSADFTINETDHYSTSSGSTSTLEYAEYTYAGADKGYISIAFGADAGTSYLTEIMVDEAVAYQAELYVGNDKAYQSINAALDAVRKMVRTNNERVSILIDPGNYEEMLVIDVPNVSLKNASDSPGIALKNKGVDIDEQAVRITSYYGHGYSYYSMADNQKWDADVLRVNKENGYLSYENKGSGTTNGSFWNATVVVSAEGFEADHIIFENSFNQYISKKESEDVVVMWESGNKGERPVDVGNTSVQNKSFVERAAAIAITNNVDKVVLNQCRVVGRQDSFFGGYNSRVVVYKGAMMGGTDYLFGGMNAVFYKSDLVMNTSDDSNDRSYITAAQQGEGRGYLMYECRVTSAEPETETASVYRSKPGYFGRPWQASTSEVVFYNTQIESSNYPGYEDQSLIMPIGWLSSLGGESTKMYEYGTTEVSGEDNQTARASWATLLEEAKLNDGTEITTFNFTKGNDNWDPLPALIEADKTGTPFVPFSNTIKVYAFGEKVHVSNVKSECSIHIYNMSGRLVYSGKSKEDTQISLEQGLWIVKVQDNKGIKAVKLSTSH